MSDSSKREPEKQKTAAMRVAPVHEIVKRLERLTDVKHRIASGYYGRPEVLAEIAARLREKL